MTESAIPAHVALAGLPARNFGPRAMLGRCRPPRLQRFATPNGLARGLVPQALPNDLAADAGDPTTRWESHRSTLENAFLAFPTFWAKIPDDSPALA
jgi:hypothetical protein